MARGPARLDPLLRWGLILFVVGSGPLLLVIAAGAFGLTRDPNPNPIGLGLLAFVSFWPSIFMMAFGWSRMRRRKWERAAGEPPEA